MRVQWFCRCSAYAHAREIYWSFWVVSSVGCFFSLEGCTVPSDETPFWHVIITSCLRLVGAVPRAVSFFGHFGLDTSCVFASNCGLIPHTIDGTSVSLMLELYCSEANRTIVIHRRYTTRALSGGIFAAEAEVADVWRFACLHVVGRMQ